MSRREKTERQILLALEEQIRETGMGGVGINAIAKRAGVSKELIYRYFDGMPGLMLAWMREQDFWTRNPGLLLSDEASQRTPADRCCPCCARRSRPWPATTPCAKCGAGS